MASQDAGEILEPHELDAKKQRKGQEHPRIKEPSKEWESGEEVANAECVSVRRPVDEGGEVVREYTMVRLRVCCAPATMSRRSTRPSIQERRMMSMRPLAVRWGEAFTSRG